MEASDQADIDLAAGQVAALLERHLPEFVTSFNLIGSAVDGDYRAGHSDLDFVAVTRRPPTLDELEALTIVHRLYASDPTLPTLDGIWITEPDLEAGPDAAGRGPATESGVFLAEAVGNRNPIAWFMLGDQSRSIVGELDHARIWRDDARLRLWTRENVETYWVRWLAESCRLTTRRGLALLGPRAVMWGVLGIGRLHATLAAGRIVSKSASGERARGTFEGRWHRILDESLRVRRGGGTSLYGNPFARRRDALDYVSMVIAAIRQLA